MSTTWSLSSYHLLSDVIYDHSEYAIHSSHSQASGEINSQSLEDTQVGYISQKYTLDKYTLEEYTLEEYTLEEYTLENF